MICIKWKSCLVSICIYNRVTYITHIYFIPCVLSIFTYTLSVFTLSKVIKHTMTHVLTFWNDVAMLLMLLVLVVLATGGHSSKGVMVSGKRCWFPFTYNFQRWVVKMRTDTRIDSQLNQFMYFLGGLSIVSPDPSISHQFSMFLSRIPWCFSGILETNRLITFTTKFHISLINFNTG